MPLDTTLYHLSSSHLRLDGRRWNELRRFTATVSPLSSSTSSSAVDGSAYLEMGNTKVICTVAGPSQQYHAGGGSRREGGAWGGGGGGAGGERGGGEEAVVVVEVGMAGFSGVERRKGGGRRLTHQIRTTLLSTFQSPATLFTHLFPHSTITITIHVLAQDGSLLATCLNAATLALIDAGIPMSDYVVACTAGIIPSPTISSGGGNGGEGGEGGDPVLDLNGTEELELAWMTVGTVGAGGEGGRDRVSVLVMESSKVPVGQVEGMLAVGVDGCKRVREMLDGAVRRQGKRVLQSAVG